MIKFFTNRELSSKLNIKLSRWKRWSREFLPPDPLGGRQSGLTRQYTVDQAFTVFLGGHLVADLDLAIAEARCVLTDLQPCFENLELFKGLNTIGSATAASGRSQEAWHIRIGRLPATATCPVRFGYRVSRRLNTRQVIKEGRQVIEEQLEELPLDGGSPTHAFDGEMSWRTLNVGVVHRRFLEQLSLSAA